MLPDAKPQAGIETLQSSVAKEAYERRLEGWGEGECGKVERICRWAERNGYEDVVGEALDCPAVEERICTTGSPPPQ